MLRRFRRNGSPTVVDGGVVEDESPPPVLFMFFSWGGTNTGLMPSLVRLMVCVIGTVLAELTSAVFLLRLKRVTVLVALVVILPLLLCFTHVGFWLDDMLYPGWRQQPIVRPLFLVGNPRSGTTWLHRLIALDDSKFTSFRTWELLVGASVTWRRLFIDLYALDQLFFLGFFTSCVHRSEKWLLGDSYAGGADGAGARAGAEAGDGDGGGGRAVHPVSLDAFEEDEWVLAHAWLSQLVMFFFPLAGGVCLRPLVQFDAAPESQLPTPVRRAIFGFYRQCVQRHLYARSHPSFLTRRLHVGGVGSPLHIQKKLIFVSKNPAFTMRLVSLYEAFPDARVVCLLRDPVQSVPSMISYISHVWHTFATPAPPVAAAYGAYERAGCGDSEGRRPPPATTSSGSCSSSSNSSSNSISSSVPAAPRRRYPDAQGLLGFCIAHYMHPLTHLRADRRPPHQWAFVGYKELRGDVEATVMSLLTHLRYRRGEDAAVDGVPVDNGDNNGDADDDDDFKDFQALLQVETARQQSAGAYVSSHTYTVEETTGMAPAELRAALAPVYAAHGDVF